MATKKPAAKPAAKSAAKPAAKSTAKSSAKSTGGSRSGAKHARRPAHYKPELSRGWSILLFCVGLVLLAMAVVPGQSVWHWLRGMLFGLFGAPTYLLNL